MNYVGSAGNDKLKGTNADDQFTITGGIDQIDGGGGIDTLIFSGLRASYSIDRKVGETKGTVTGAETNTTFKSAEILKFADGQLDLATNTWTPSTPPPPPPHDTFTWHLIDNGNVTEGNQFFVEITRTSGDQYAEFVPVVVRDGNLTATPYMEGAPGENDFQFYSDPVRFEAGETTKIVSIGVAYEHLALEGVETATIDLVADVAGGFQISPDGANVLNIHDYTPPPPPPPPHDTFTWHLIDNGNVTEGNQFFVEITRTSGDQYAEFVPVVVRDGNLTATPYMEGAPGENDFQFYSDPVRFEAGETTKIVSIGVAYAHVAFEGVETATIDLMADVAGGFQISPDGANVLNIYDFIF